MSKVEHEFDAYNLKVDAAHKKALETNPAYPLIDKHLTSATKKLKRWGKIHEELSALRWKILRKLIHNGKNEL